MNWALFNDAQRGEAPDVRTLPSRRQVARREHPCSLCDGVIGVGSVYDRCAAVVDGVFQVARLHTHACWEE